MTKVMRWVVVAVMIVDAVAIVVGVVLIARAIFS